MYEPRTGEEIVAGLFSNKRTYPDANAFIVPFEAVKSEELKSFLRFECIFTAKSASFA